MLRILILLFFLGTAGGLFMLRAWTLFRLVRLGQPVKRTDDLPKRVQKEVVVSLGQKKLLQRLGPGLMHAFIFWGFLVLLTTVIEVFGEVVDERFAIPFIGRSGWLGLVQAAGDSFIPWAILTAFRNSRVKMIPKIISRMKSASSRWLPLKRSSRRTLRK